MRNETRCELLEALAKLRDLRPEWRLGQTLANLAMTAGRMDPGGVWDLEDDEALTAAHARHRTILRAEFSGKFSDREASCLLMVEYGSLP